MKTDTKQNIYDYIARHDAVSVKNLLDAFDINQNMMHRHLKDLIKQWKIQKTGKTPKVFYMISKLLEQENNNSLEYEDIEFLDNNYYSYSSDGRLMKWYSWFENRCIMRNMDIHKQFEIYKWIITYIKSLKDKDWIIDWMSNLSDKLGNIYIDKLWYIDAYQVWHFGRSKLGSIAFYAKQSKNQDLIDQVINIIKIPIKKYIKQNSINAICYVPPSIDRHPQLMTEIKKWLNLDLPEIEFQKLFPNNVIIPQKSLKSMDQRIQNATNTLFLMPNQKHYQNVLIIDDFMWSGATINICASKLKKYNIADKIFAISLLGNIDTKYEVINEI